MATYEAGSQGPAGGQPPARRRPQVAPALMTRVRRRRLVGAGHVAEQDRGGAARAAGRAPPARRAVAARARPQPGRHLRPPVPRRDREPAASRSAASTRRARSSCAVEPQAHDARRVGVDGDGGRRACCRSRASASRSTSASRRCAGLANDRRAAGRAGPRDARVGAARPRDRRGRAARDGADRARRHARRRRRPGARPRRRPCRRTCTSSTSPGCARRRGASASPPPSTRPQFRDELRNDQRGHRPPPRGLGRARRAVRRLAGVAAALEARRGCSRRGDHLTGRAKARRGDVKITLEPVEQLSAPGLAGVTIESASGASVSLDRAAGRPARGARARARASERAFTVMGASRGEGGILGEGVRQALLRDRTYKPALTAARAMVSVMDSRSSRTRTRSPSARPSCWPRRAGTSRCRAARRPRRPTRWRRSGGRTGAA